MELSKNRHVTVRETCWRVRQHVRRTSNSVWRSLCVGIFKQWCAEVGVAGKRITHGWRSRNKDQTYRWREPLDMVSWGISFRWSDGSPHAVFRIRSVVRLRHRWEFILNSSAGFRRNLRANLYHIAIFNNQPCSKLAEKKFILTNWLFWTNSTASAYPK